MAYTSQEVDEIIKSRNSTEWECLEFKTDPDFDDKKRSDYCAGISNAGGGILLLGVDKYGNISGSNLYKNRIHTIPLKIRDVLGIFVKVEEVNHSKGRVVIFTIPPRPHGRAVKSNGSKIYPIRVGESLVEMNDQEFRNINNEPQLDYTAEIVRDLKISDLNQDSIKVFRAKWSNHSGNNDYLKFNDEEILRAAELITDKGITRAALILFGTQKALGIHLSCCEIILEWRQISNKTSHDFRKEWRNSAFQVLDEIWNEIAVRNIHFSFTKMYERNEILAFNESVIREAILNAITHRDYRDIGSVFIEASPEIFCIKSPGGLLPGITPQNIIKRHKSRNRLLTEAFQRVNFIERSGQGVDKIFRICIEEGKGEPSFQDTDDFQVVLSIPAVLKDESFVNFLNRITKKKNIIFSIDEILELEKIRMEGSLKQVSNKEKFLDCGIIERIGHGRATRYILSHNYYKHEGKVGDYTKIIGIPRNLIKEQIVLHIKKNQKTTAREMQEIFPALSRIDIQNILQELKKSHKIKCIGTSKGAYWVLNS